MTFCVRKAHTCLVGSDRHLLCLQRAAAGVGPHECPECGRRFTLSQNLMAHRRKQHAGVYLHRCPECGKGYDNRNHLHGHLVSRHHRKEFMAHCPHCGKAFAHRDNMRAHVKAHHPGAALHAVSSSLPLSPATHAAIAAAAMLPTTKLSTSQENT